MDYIFISLVEGLIMKIYLFLEFFELIFYGEMWGDFL
jgi:hypothetical protein